jgi:integrase
MGIKVSLRQKSISKGRKSLYLDFYPPIPHPKTGKPTRREFLNIYIAEKPKNPLERQGDRQTLELAEQIRRKRENFLNKPEIYSEYEKEQLRKKELGERNFVAYFKGLADRKRASNHDNWMSAFNYLNAFTNGNVKFADLNETFFNDFKEHLLTTKSTRSKKANLSPNSANSYFNKIKAALKQAFKDGLLTTDLNSKIKPIEGVETHRNFLTIEELNELIRTPCNNPLLKRAALFSALTGLRFSDIGKLIWNEVEHIEGEGYILKFTQQKTKGAEVLPISEQAYDLMGEASDPEEKVFKGLKYSAYHNRHLFQWIGAAGITKDITFHCFRHTFATLQLSSGTDITTISKMLGHKDLKTTQIYAKIVDESKRKAVNKIKLDF